MSTEDIEKKCSNCGRRILLNGSTNEEDSIVMRRCRKPHGCGEFTEFVPVWEDI